MLYDPKEPIRDCFRHAVLDALDMAASDNGLSHGWKDSDLPRLFRVIDELAELCAERDLRTACETTAARIASV